MASILTRASLCLFLMTGASVAQVPDASSATTPHRTNTELVVVDVVVTDRSGNHVQGLQSSDFALFEDGQPKAIEGFDSQNNSHPVNPNVRPEHGPTTPKAPSSQPNPRSLTVLVVDILNSDIPDQEFAKAQVLKFLRAMPEGALVALYLVERGSIEFQPPTTDKQLLLRMAERIRPRKVQLRLSDSERRNLAGEPAYTGLQPPTSNSTKESWSLLNSTEYRYRNYWTLNSLENTTQRIEHFPGRKSIVWLTGSIPMNTDYWSEKVRKDAPQAITDEWVHFSQKLTSARVAVYPMDIRALPSITTMTTDLSALTKQSTLAREGDPQSSVLVRKRELSTMKDARLLQTLAERTGGKASVSNDLAKAMQQCLGDGNYYSLFFKPPKGEKEGTYHKLEVRVARPDVHLQYRREYFHSTEPPGLLFRDLLRSAAAFQAPERSDIKLTVSEQSPSEKSGPLRVIYTLDLAGIAFKVADGAHSTDLNFLTVAYDEEGREVERVEDTLRARLREEDFKSFSEKGLSAAQQIILPPGTYTIRVAVLDQASGNLGARKLHVDVH